MTMAKMCNEGINDALNILWKGTTRPSFYLGLYTNTSEPAATATLTSITEPSGGSYARVALSDGDWTVASQIATNLQKTLAASGAAWGNVYGYFICTAASGTSGKLYAVEQFSDGPYNVVDGGSVKITPKFTES
jgi:hypothetical protein